MSLYATVAEVKRALSAANANPQREDYDYTILETIEALSRAIDSFFYADRPLFAPYKETRRIVVDGTNVDSASGLFRFANPLLELTSVSASGTSLTVNTGVFTYPGTVPPYRALRLAGCDAGGISSWYYTGCDGCGGYPYVEINGIWGAHPNYAQAWYAADALASNLDIDDLTFTVADADGAGKLGIKPRFSPGAIVKIDSEIMNVIAVDNSTNTITVAQRGDNGTTAATHTSTTVVYVWQMPTDLKQAIRRQVGMMVQRLGSYVSTELTGAGEIRYPTDWLWELKNRLDRYVYG